MPARILIITVRYVYFIRFAIYSVLNSWLKLYIINIVMD